MAHPLRLNTLTGKQRGQALHLARAGLGEPVKEQALDSPVARGRNLKAQNERKNPSVASRKGGTPTAPGDVGVKNPMLRALATSMVKGTRMNRATDAPRNLSRVLPPDQDQRPRSAPAGGLPAFQDRRPPHGLPIPGTASKYYDPHLGGSWSDRRLANPRPQARIDPHNPPPPRRRAKRA